jgi:hypothetical protein
VRLGPALAVLVPSAVVLLVSALAVRRPRRAIDEVPVAVAGAGLGAGGLLLQADVSIAAWWVTPPLVAGLAVWHVRALFRGAGPLRV